MFQILKFMFFLNFDQNFDIFFKIIFKHKKIILIFKIFLYKKYNIMNINKFIKLLCFFELF